MSTLNSVLMGAVAMASLVAAVFFLRFWRQTRDALFLSFACAFSLDAVSRFAVALTDPASESEPLFYLARLGMFGLIILAIALKNRRKEKP